MSRARVSSSAGREVEHSQGRMLWIFSSSNLKLLWSSFRFNTSRSASLVERLISLGITPRSSRSFTLSRNISSFTFRVSNESASSVKLLLDFLESTEWLLFLLNFFSDFEKIFESDALAALETLCTSFEEGFDDFFESFCGERILDMKLFLDSFGLSFNMDRATELLRETEGLWGVVLSADVPVEEWEGIRVWTRTRIGIR